MKRASGNYDLDADAIEMKRANVRNYAFVTRGIEMKQTSLNYLFVEGQSPVFKLVREELKAV